MSLVSQFTKGQSVSGRKMAITIGITNAVVGSGVGIVQGIVEAHDQVIMGVRLSHLVPVVEVIGGIAAMAVGKQNMIRVIGSDLTIAGSTLLGYKILAPKVISLIPTGTATRQISNRINQRAPSGTRGTVLGYNPSGFYS
jgi:hypothetical protein